MPNILDPQGVSSPSKRDAEALSQVSYDYDYPIEKNLRPLQEDHRELVSKVMLRARESMNVMSRRHTDWREIDKVLRVYVPPERKKRKKGDDDESDAPRIIMPETHATLETLLTYMVAAFLQDPIIRYQGQGPEDVFGAKLMQVVVDHQAKRNGLGLNLHTMFRDNFAYGIGPVSPVWHREFGKKTVRHEFGVLDEVMGMIFPTRKERRTSEYRMLYEGNILKNIDPYRFLPDPNVSAHEVQEGEFVGWIERTNLMQLLKRDQDSNDFVFNGKYLKHIDGRTNLFTQGERTPSNARGRESDYVTSNSPVDVVWMYVDIIPNDWGLGREEYPETWLFGVAGDSILIAAQPLNLDHGQKPVAVACTEFDGYSPNPISRLGIINDAQNLVDFLYTSHMQNVKKAINDMFIIDPSIVNIYDVANPKPGKLIRTRRAAWGRGQLDQAIKQFDVRDVTHGHIADANMLASMMQRVTASDKQMQGQMEGRTTRVSATEAQGIRGGSLSRLEKAARMISMQAMMPIGRMFASHIQQLMEEETYVNVVGEMEKELIAEFPNRAHEIENHRLRVNPLDMVVDYDIVPHDGTIPGGEDVTTWTQLFQTISASPELLQQFDTVKIFKHIARELGAKNVSDFERMPTQPPQVQSDEETMREVERGNLIPMENGAQR